MLNSPRREDTIGAPANHLRGSGHLDQHFVGSCFTAGGYDIAEIECRLAAANISLPRRIIEV